MTTRSGQFIGGAVSLGLVVLWLVFAFFNPYGKQGQTPQTWVTVAVMIALAIAGLAFALTRRAAGVLIVAGASLLPVGLYLLGTPGLFRWIGILCCVSLDTHERQVYILPFVGTAVGPTRR